MSQETIVMTERAEVLRPFSHLVGRGILAILALTTPVFAVAYWLAIPTDSWPIVLALHATVLVLTVIAVIAFLETSIEIDGDTVRERGFFGRVTSISGDEVGDVLIVDLYQNITLETQPQFFVTKRSGELALRMRGQFWPRESMDRVAAALETEITLLPDSVTLSELRKRSPQLLYWFERFPSFGRLTGRD